MIKIMKRVHAWEAGFNKKNGMLCNSSSLPCIFSYIYRNAAVHPWHCIFVNNHNYTAFCPDFRLALMRLYETLIQEGLSLTPF